MCSDRLQIVRLGASLTGRFQIGVDAKSRHDRRQFRKRQSRGAESAGMTSADRRSCGAAGSPKNS